MPEKVPACMRQDCLLPLQACGDFSFWWWPRLIGNPSCETETGTETRPICRSQRRRIGAGSASQAPRLHVPLCNMGIKIGGFYKVIPTSSDKAQQQSVSFRSCFLIPNRPVAAGKPHQKPEAKNADAGLHQPPLVCG